eukprot:m.213951 g.213951  ORF g.213951 m.213951 type:complete len:453 (-) comp15581_c0_seq1:3107-4465(-)
MMKLALILLLATCAAALNRRLYAPDSPLNTDWLHLPHNGDTFSKVDNIGNSTSYAGFFNVNQNKNNNLFAWYFPAQSGAATAPLLIWLQGGPGGASTFGLFSEIGPYTLDASLNLVPRPYTWNREFGLLFIDNPVGAGFSYTGTGAYAQDQDAVSDDLYAFMQKFYDYFPQLLNNDLYITGESFAGHYIPAFAAKIHDRNKAGGQPHMPLKGVSIGDGWTDPIIQLTGYADLLWAIGMLSEQQYHQFQNLTTLAVSAIERGDLVGAFKWWDIMMNGDLFPYGTYFFNCTGSSNYDNFATITEPASFGYFSQYLTQDKIRAALHVGNATFNDGRACETNLMADVMRSYKRDLGLVMDNYKVLLYNGQNDIIVGALLTERYLPTIPWQGATGFSSSPRKIWRGGPEGVYGYFQQYQQFTYAIIRNAGHIVPYDQPAAAYDLITRFVRNLPFPSK